MPEQMPSGAPGVKNDLIGGLAAKFGEAAISRFFGNDVPESDKAAILEDLVNVLSELTVINRYFAEQIFNKFGDEETGELKRKPDIRDFLTCWAEASIRLMAEEELAKSGVDNGEAEAGDEGDQEGGGGDGGGEADEQPPAGRRATVVDAEFRRVK